MNTVIVDGEKCKGCRLCIDVCPKKCLELSKSFNKAGYHPAVFISQKGCTACGFCYHMCPEICMEVYQDDD